eukprot:TRINITY_DN22486_c0_g2_i26.p2 TRINITY_DN22486_c0_g2~~TRINITY_DN22486_c0_g2_i26.p2  ORF type:complete len:210 (+),score=41.02 TRINITY_DN22486_c0_g2_i26:29-631(+)
MGGCCSPEAPQVDAPAGGAASVTAADTERAVSIEPCAEINITELTYRVHQDQATEGGDQEKKPEALPGPKGERGDPETQQSLNAHPEPLRYALFTPEVASAVHASERPRQCTQIDDETREEEERLLGVARGLKWSSDGDPPQPHSKEPARRGKEPAPRGKEPAPRQLPLRGSKPRPQRPARVQPADESRRRAAAPAAGRE